MKILIVGGTGTLGQAVVKELQQRHEIVVIGKSTGDFQMDITDPASVRATYEKIGPFDALVCTAGRVHFGPLEILTHDQLNFGLQDKLLGQVNLVLNAFPYARDKASFTLTSGVLSDDPVVFGAAVSMVSGAVDAFVRAAAIEMPRGMRINVVSPGVLQESMDKYAAFFRGHEPVSAARAALAYSKSVEGGQTGQIYRVV